MLPRLDPPSRPLLWGFGVEAVVGAGVLLLAIVLVVPTLLLGGFEAVPPKALPRTQPGQTVAYGHFRFTPLKAEYVRVSPDPSARLDPDDFSSDKKPPALVVTMRITNLSDTPSNPASSFDPLFLLTPPGKGEPVGPDDSILVRDGSGLPDLQPRMPENVQLVWNLGRSKVVPSRLLLTLQKETYRESFFTQRNEWTDVTPWVQVPMAVTKP